jgi:DNA polymerase
MRDYRKANIILRRAEHILQRIKPDGRFSFSWLYGGAHTLRWAGGSDYRRGGTGETGFNVQNQQKEPTYITDDYEIVVDKEELAEIEAGKRGYLRKVDLRARVIAPPGKKLIIFDAAQIEPRILKWLITLIFPKTKEAASARDDLDRVAAGESIYEVHARKTMGWTGGNIKKEAPRKQFIAKQRVLGLGYQCGYKKFHDQCAIFGVNIPMDESKSIVADFRAKERGIVKLWYRIDSDFKECRDKNYEIELPDGSILTYFDVRVKPRVRKVGVKNEGDVYPPSSKNATQKGRTEREVTKLEFCARTERDGRIKWFYGGLIVENIVQRIAREIMAEMLLACDDEGWPILFHVHDEGILEVDQDVDLDHVLQTVAVTPDWAEGLPIEAEGKESPHYLKD